MNIQKVIPFIVLASTNSMADNNVSISTSSGSQVTATQVGQGTSAITETTLMHGSGYIDTTQPFCPESTLTSVSTNVRGESYSETTLEYVGNVSGYGVGSIQTEVSSSKSLNLGYGDITSNTFGVATSTTSFSLNSESGYGLEHTTSLANFEASNETAIGLTPGGFTMYSNGMSTSGTVGTVDGNSVFNYADAVSMHGGVASLEYSNNQYGAIYVGDAHISGGIMFDDRQYMGVSESTAYGNGSSLSSSETSSNINVEYDYSDHKLSTSEYKNVSSNVVGDGTSVGSIVTEFNINISQDINNSDDDHEHGHDGNGNDGHENNHGDDHENNHGGDHEHGNDGNSNNDHGNNHDDHEHGNDGNGNDDHENNHGGDHGDNNSDGHEHGNDDNGDDHHGHHYHENHNQ